MFCMCGKDGLRARRSHVVEPQIAEHECRSGENFIHAGHEPEGAIVNVPPERTRELHRLGAHFLPHSFDRRQRFFSELMGAEGVNGRPDSMRVAQRLTLLNRPWLASSNVERLVRSSARRAAPSQSFRWCQVDVRAVSAPWKTPSVSTNGTRVLSRSTRSRASDVNIVDSNSGDSNSGW